MNQKFKLSLGILLLVPFINPFASEKNISNESQLSILQTGGNSTVETYNLKTQTKIDTDEYLYTLGGHYLLSFYETTNDNGDKVNVDSVRNWSVAFKGEKALNDKYNIFSQLQIEGDVFSGYEQRDNYDLGLKYKYIETKKEKFFTEIGYRYSVERKIEKDSDGEDILFHNKGRIYTEYANRPNETYSYNLWIEYLPNFTKAQDYLIIAEPSLSMILTNVFSLKFSYKGIYDNDPATDDRKYMDYSSSTTLIAKY